MSANLIIVTGLSGAGKTVLVEYALAHIPLSCKVLTSTTRPPRPGEIDEVHYRFFSRKEFTARRIAGEFVEYKPNVYGNMYGARHEDIWVPCETHDAVFYVVDIRGMCSLCKSYPDARTVLVSSTTEEITGRLRERNLSEDDFRARINAAKRELGQIRKQRFDLIVDNHDGNFEKTAEAFIDNLELLLDGDYAP